MSNVTLKVNGKNHTVDIDPSTPLLYILRNDLDLRGPRFGCGWASAAPVRSSLMEWRPGRA
jgi:aerobic-type carbon monoxide dehydrogenase small subunit (CoxS/CutS family)